MTLQPMLPFAEELETAPQKRARSGSFVDNMALPIHRWFRYSAGFSGEWARSLLIDAQLAGEHLNVFDPFAGSGTTLLAADSLAFPSMGVEAHPFVVRLARAKLMWSTSIPEFVERAKWILRLARHTDGSTADYPELITRCFSPSALAALSALKNAWLSTADGSAASELTWLALTAILRRSSGAGTAQWQYILPNRSKSVVDEPFAAFQMQVQMMRQDMQVVQATNKDSRTRLLLSDARCCPEVPDDYADIVITSPPYANNYDYADATRFEMTFWGEVADWSDLHPVIRRRLIVSSSQHASAEKYDLDSLLAADEIAPIQEALGTACRQLADKRQHHGGKKHYHTMVAAYFRDMSLTWRELRRICKPGAKAIFVIGDSAPYGVHIPVEQWLGELAVAASFHTFSFTKLRDRNIKWKNRKHDVPLQEGILAVQG